MLKGTKVLIACMVLALVVYLVNVVMLDDFLYEFTSKTAVDPDSSFYAGDLMSMFAQLCSFMPILIIILGIGYALFDRVFGQEIQDWRV
jgi:hypothetical protein